MGSSYSCFVAKSRGTKKNKLPRKHEFIWKIDGFTSLLEQGEGSTTTSFEMMDILWNLSMNPMDSKSGATDSEKHVSLGLVAQELCPNYKLETKVKFFIHDQRDGKHIEREVSHTYLTTSHQSRVSCMIPLETLKNPSLGFLVKDSIAVGVELIEFKKVPCNGVERSRLLPKNRSSGSFSWYIEDFSRLRSYTISKPFEIAGYIWTLNLEPESLSNYVGLLLTLLESKSGSHLPPSSGVMADAVLSIKRQSRGVLADEPLGTGTLDPHQLNICYQKFIPGQGRGSWYFIKRKDFQKPSNGYLIKGRCTIEVSVCVYGSENDCSS